MLNALAVVIFLGVAFLMYRWIIKHRGSITLGWKAFLRAFLGGALPCTLCIMILELTFDRFIFKSGGSIGDEVLTSFARAA